MVISTVAVLDDFIVTLTWFSVACYSILIENRIKIVLHVSPRGTFVEIGGFQQIDTNTGFST